MLDTDDQGGVLMHPRKGAISIELGDGLQAFSGELLVIAVRAGEDAESAYELPPAVREFDSAVCNGLLADLVTEADFKAKAASSTEVGRLPGATPKRVVLYGLGTPTDGRKHVSAAAKFAVQKGMAVKKCQSVGLYVESGDGPDASFASEGAITGAYVDERYREKKEVEKVPQTFVLVGFAKTADTEAAVGKGRALGLGIITTKDAVNAPANCLTPATLATAARTVASECALDVTVLGREECEQLGMGSYLGVGRGSTDEPQFIHMVYRPAGAARKKVCLVGKAVTFDTGGSNLKVGAGSMIDMMKIDMGGAAAVLGAAKTIGETKPEGIEVHFIMPGVENMLSDRAIHPGDILKASNGKTVEVLNTDAEGRLCLADALVYAEKLGEVDYIVDVATLTGAMVVALGNDVAGFWSASDGLADRLSDSSEFMGEKLWRMPLVSEYAEQLKSKIADLRNIGTGRAAGSIIAALFLKEFVKSENWAHIDIAGTAFADKQGGATGFGVKTFVQFVDGLAAEK